MLQNKVNDTITYVTLNIINGVVIPSSVVLWLGFLQAKLDQVPFTSWIEIETLNNALMQFILADIPIDEIDWDDVMLL